MKQAAPNNVNAGQTTMTSIRRVYDTVLFVPTQTHMQAENFIEANRTNEILKDGKR